MVADAEDPVEDGAEAPDNPCQDEECPEGWEDLMDSNIRTKQLAAGVGPVPEMHDDVRCSFSVRAAASCSDADAALAARKYGEGPEVLQEQRDCWFRIGEGEAVPGMELALRNMAEGGAVEVFCTHRFGWSSTGSPSIQPDEKTVPPDCNVSIHIVVHEITRASTRVMDDSEESLKARIKEATWRKTNGNDHFKRRFLMKAAKSYGRGMEAFQGLGMEVPANMPEREALQATVNGLVVDCGANLSAVHLENDNPKECLRATEAVLTLQPNHVKALYRAGCAHLRLGDHKQCQDCVTLVQEIEPQNVAIKRLAQDLRKAKQRHEANTKAIGKKLVQDVGWSAAESEAVKLGTNPLQWARFLKRRSWELNKKIEAFSPILWGITHSIGLGVLVFIIALILRGPSDLAQNTRRPH